MATSNITDLVSKVSSDIEARTQHLQSSCTSCGRTGEDVVAELREALARVPDAITDAEALLDIAAVEALCEEMEAAAAFIAAALFLGRRLIISDLQALAELVESDELPLDVGRQVAEVLDDLSRRLRDELARSHEAAADSAA